MHLDQLSKRRSREQGHVPREQDHRASTIGEECLCLLQRVSRPELRRLHDTLNVPAPLDTAPDEIGLMPYNQGYRRWANRVRGTQDVLDHGKPNRRVKDLWHGRPHPGSLSGREDNNMDVRRRRQPSILRSLSIVEYTSLVVRPYFFARPAIADRLLGELSVIRQNS